MDKYNPKDIEQKWQKYWEKHKTFEVTENPTKKKFYGLIEFPYPSAAGLHVGHTRSNMAIDVITRKRRMEGFNVLYPIGFDSFGLPTENFAIKTGRQPAEITKENIAIFTRQLKALGFSFDWSRSVTTSDSEYYRWTQWIFLQFFKHGLAYKNKQPINWCPKDKIGLANEEVVDGMCERCKGPVEKRDKEQWMLAITKYADKLLDGLNDVDYISRAKIQQENWIGRSEGAVIKFSIFNFQFSNNHKKVRSDSRPEGVSQIEVFTTRPDTIFGATYLVVAPEHPLIVQSQEFIANRDEVMDYGVNAKRKTDLERSAVEKEKTGVELKGVKAINPANGEEIPVWVADYVLASYGTGAIMAVPAHDERDWEFAKKYSLPVKEVVAKKCGERLPNAIHRDGVAAVMMKDDKILVLFNKKINEFCLPAGGYEDGESDTDTLRREIIEETGYTNFEIKDYLGQIEANYFALGKNVNRHRYLKGYQVILKSEEKKDTKFGLHEDFENAWFSSKEAAEKLSQSAYMKGQQEEFISRVFNERQRCFRDEGVAVNSDFLNGLFTPEAKAKMITWLEEKGIGKRKVQYKLRDWVFSRQRYWGEPIPVVYCEKCAGWIPLPETDLPLKLPDVKNYQPTDTGESPLAAMTDWVNTKCPKCDGPARRETDTMPNWAGSSWYFLAYALKSQEPGARSQEYWDKSLLNYWMPVDWYNGGMEHTVLHLLYSRFWNQFLYDIGAVPTREPYKKRTSHGMILASDGQKMSKSLGNVINPDEMVELYGADALRTYILFMGPFDQQIAWDTNGLIGVRRFLERVWLLQSKIVETRLIASLPGRLETLLHQTIKKVTEDIEAMRFNTAIAKMMELSNEMNKEEAVSSETYQIFLKLLSPFAPHLAEELWSMTGCKGSIAFEPWPTYDPGKIVSDTVTIAIQVNGKLRDTIILPSDASEADATSAALASEKVQKWLEGKEPKKVIYVKGKLISIVI